MDSLRGNFFNVLLRPNTTSISVALISFPFKTFSVLFSLCARLNGQLACQFSSANYASRDIIIYHAISYHIINDSNQYVFATLFFMQSTNRAAYV